MGNDGASSNDADVEDLLQSLPRPILGVIVSFLDLDEQLRMATTSRTMRAVVAEVRVHVWWGAATPPSRPVPMFTSPAGSSLHAWELGVLPHIPPQVLDSSLDDLHPYNPLSRRSASRLSHPSTSPGARDRALRTPCHGCPRALAVRESCGRWPCRGRCVRRLCLHS